MSNRGRPTRDNGRCTVYGVVRYCNRLSFTPRETKILLFKPLHTVHCDNSIYSIVVGPSGECDSKKHCWNG